MSRKNQITGISIHRKLRAPRFGFSRETVVYILREGTNGDSYSTNPTLDNAKISDASVLRAKRAQMALVQNAQPIAAQPATKSK